MRAHQSKREPQPPRYTILLELAKQLGNVSQACKMMGYSRDSFYRFRAEQRHTARRPVRSGSVIPFTGAVAKLSPCSVRSATLALNTSSSGNPDRTLTLLPAWMTEPGQAAGHASSAIDREIGGIAFAGRCAHGVLHGGLALLSGSQRWGAHDANKGICSKRDGPQNFGPICGAG